MGSNNLVLPTTTLFARPASVMYLRMLGLGFQFPQNQL